MWWWWWWCYVAPMKTYQNPSDPFPLQRSLCFSIFCVHMCLCVWVVFNNKRSFISLSNNFFMLPYSPRFTSQTYGNKNYFQSSKFVLKLLRNLNDCYFIVTKGKYLERHVCVCFEDFHTDMETRSWIGFPIKKKVIQLSMQFRWDLRLGFNNFVIIQRAWMGESWYKTNIGEDFDCRWMMNKSHTVWYRFRILHVCSGTNGWLFVPMHSLFLTHDDN